jgi:DNA-binding XRE family transcriptional regulator
MNNQTLLDAVRCKKRLEELEKEYIRVVLTQFSGNKKEAAKLLGISRALLLRKIKKYNWSEFSGHVGVGILIKANLVSLEQMESGTQIKSGLTRGIRTVTKYELEKIKLGQIIRDARRSKKISQLALAFELGYKGQAYVSQIETGEKIPSPLVAKKLSTILELDQKTIMDQLFSIKRESMLNQIERTDSFSKII